MNFLTLLLLLSIHLVAGRENPFVLDINCDVLRGEPISHFWTSTGFSPTPIVNTSTFLLSKDEEINLAFIGAVPNDGITHVRVHWLLDLIKINCSCSDQQAWKYDFRNLFAFIWRLKINGLSPGFELMGNPSGCFSNWTQLSQHWPNFLRYVVARLIVEFGYDYVSTWRFESHNEPDLKSYNTWNLTTSEFVNHILSTSDALAAFNLPLWAPAGLFKDRSRHPLCWGLLDYCQLHSCPVQVLTFHKKGDGVASQVVQRGRDLALQIQSNYSRLNFSFVNDEADPLTGWMEPAVWRADVRYAAAVAQNVIGYWKSFKDIGASLMGISNDNAFLGFYPHYWTQRTLLARIQMNNTQPTHIQMFKKPVIVLMELLSLLCEQLIDIKYSVGNPGLSYIATKETNHTVIMVVINNDTLSNSTWMPNETRLIINLQLPAVPLPGLARSYLLDNKLTNPFGIWESAGQPDYPDPLLRRKMRQQEIPWHRDFQFKSGQPNNITIKFTTSVPAILLINICFDEEFLPGPPRNLRFIPITRNEALLIWDDSIIKSRCLKSFVVDHRKSIEDDFKIIPGKDFLSTSYHVDGCDPTIINRCQAIEISGQYRVAAMNLWNKLGPFSNVITL